MIRLVTDSNTMVPAELRDRFAIAQVPLTVVVDGEAQLEDAIEHAAFFAALRRGAVVSTAAPAPGAFVQAYDVAARAGASRVLSIHVGANYSGTVNAARVAAGMAEVPVTVVDTANASFAAGIAVLRAAEQIAADADAEAAVAACESVAAGVASVFTVADLDRARRGGRVDADDGAGVPVLAMQGSDLAEIGRAFTIDEAAAVMAAHITAGWVRPLRVAVGAADDAVAFAALHDRLAGSPVVADLMGYDVGPSVAAHTGAGTFGAVFHPYEPD